jgi:hypothetical protein
MVANVLGTPGPAAMAAAPPPPGVAFAPGLLMRPQQLYDAPVMAAPGAAAACGGFATAPAGGGGAPGAPVVGPPVCGGMQQFSLQPWL